MRASHANEPIEMAPRQTNIAIWNGIHFHGFNDSHMTRLSAPAAKLQIREGSPPLLEVMQGCVSPVSLKKQARHIGVYDKHENLVGASVATRRESHIALSRVDRASLRQAKIDNRAAYYLGCSSRQYGHFILETLSRAWAWEQHGRDCVPIVQNAIPPFGRPYYGFISGLAERVEEVQEVTRFERVVVPSPAFIIGRETHREFRALCQRISENAVPMIDGSTEQPVYLSRTGLGDTARRVLVGEDRLERLLASEGFLIIRPETLPIAEQIALFNRHKWIVAPVGSACHTRLFSRQPTNLVMLTKAQLNANFILCDLISDGVAHYANVLSAPDLGVRVPRGLPEPLMLDDDRTLGVLKNLGLIRPKAGLGSPPDMESYKRTWIGVAERAARKRIAASEQSAFRRAIARVTASLE